MSFIPKNEQGLIALFFENIDKTNFSLVSIQTDFPDAILEMNGQQYKTEFEYKSSNFFKHNHNMFDCDLVICWKHDTKMIIPVIELSDPNWYLFNEEKIDPHLSLISHQSREIRKLNDEIKVLQDEIKKLNSRLADSERKYGILKNADGKLHKYRKTVNTGLSYDEKMALLRAWVEEIERIPKPQEIMDRWDVSQGTAYNYLKNIKQFKLTFLEN